MSGTGVPDGMVDAIRVGVDGFGLPRMEPPAKNNETTGRMQAPPFLVDCPQRFFRDGPAPKPRDRLAPPRYCLRAMASPSSSFDIEDRPFTPNFLARS